MELCLAGGSKPRRGRNPFRAGIRGACGGGQFKTTAQSIPNTKLGLPIEGRDHIQGNIKAPITLLEYGDYECPYCGEAYPIVKEIQERLGEKLSFTFRNFPLANSHPHAVHAAEAAEAAAAQGHFWEMHDALYENQQALEDEDLAQYAADLGLDAERLIREVQSRQHEVRVKEDFKGGMHAGVNGTPTFFINGERYDGPRDVESFLEALAEK
ncbi:MAG TPA: DsbA family protein [Pseudomonadales bacterium]|nr:DsbA family protein [Pseudomonadales bacterium]